MAAFGLIVFREVLEIALVLSILLAATKNLPRRSTWVLSGLLAGLLSAALVAAFTEQISTVADGMGQELFNAIVLLLASALIGFTVVWMSRTGKGLTAQLRETGRAISTGGKPLYVLSIVIALSVLREGAEVALLSYGVLASGGSNASLLLGGLIGALAGIAVGALMYLGVLRSSTRYIFQVSNLLLIAVSAGMAAQGINFLLAAQVLPLSDAPIWDTSNWLPETTLLGTLLHALVGYSARPSFPQFLAFFSTFILLVTIVFQPRVKLFSWRRSL